MDKIATKIIISDGELARRTRLFNEKIFGKKAVAAADARIAAKSIRK